MRLRGQAGSDVTVEGGAGQVRAGALSVRCRERGRIPGEDLLGEEDQREGNIVVSSFCCFFEEKLKVIFSKRLYFGIKQQQKMFKNVKIKHCRFFFLISFYCFKDCKCCVFFSVSKMTLK